MNHEKREQTAGSGQITRREALKGLGGVVAASTLPEGLSAAVSGAQSPAVRTERNSTTGKPNILWITGEGVPLHVLSCYGSRLIETPHIDRIAKEGMRLDNAFVSNALCAPSRATLLTGAYSHVNGMVGNPDNPAATGADVARFDPAQVTFPKLLRQHGYQTGTVGKWHLPVNPADVGFDYFLFKKGAGGPYYDPAGYLGNAQLGSRVIQEYRHEGYETDVMTDLAIKGMEEFRQPFFMMMQFFNAHRPFDPPHRYEHLYDRVRIPEPGTFWDDYRHRAAPARAARMKIEDMPDFHPPADLTGRQRKQWNYQQFMAHFLGTLRSQDDNIGRLLDFLESRGLAENTIVVYTTDHGFFLGDHGWFDKRFMYEQALRVPWMIRYPGRVEPGSVRADWTVNIDNAPTVLDMAGLPIPSVMQGRSLLPILEGGSPPADWRTSAYYHYYEFGPPHWVAPHYGIRTERFKLISYYEINQWEMFDLQKDPDEMENLFTETGFRVQPAYESAAKELVAQLGSLRKQFGDTTGRPVTLWPPSD